MEVSWELKPLIENSCWIKMSLNFSFAPLGQCRPEGMGMGDNTSSFSLEPQKTCSWTFPFKKKLLYQARLLSEDVLFKGKLLFKINRSLAERLAVVWVPMVLVTLLRVTQFRFFWAEEGFEFMSVTSWARTLISRAFNMKHKLMHFKSSGLDSWALQDGQKSEHNPKLCGSSWLMPGPQEGQDFKGLPFWPALFSPCMVQRSWDSCWASHQWPTPEIQSGAVPDMCCCLSFLVCLLWGIRIVTQEYLFIQRISAFHTVTWGLYVKRLKYLSFQFIQSSKPPHCNCNLPCCQGMYLELLQT